MSNKKRRTKELTNVDSAIIDLVNIVSRIQLKHNLRVYQIYAVLKDLKMVIKFDKKTKERFLSNEKLIIEVGL